MKFIFIKYFPSYEIRKLQPLALAPELQIYCVNYFCTATIFVYFSIFW